jgi:hypothetical protein
MPGGSEVVGATYAWLVVASAVVANLLIGGMFPARVVRPEWGRRLGLSVTAMAIPLGVASVVAVASGADRWEVVLPAVFVGFALVEVLVDLIGLVDVRTTRGWVPPWCRSPRAVGAGGARFRIGPRSGVAVLPSHLVCLAATAFSYRRVGHGTGTTGPLLGSPG